MIAHLPPFSTKFASPAFGQDVAVKPEGLQFPQSDITPE